MQVQRHLSSLAEVAVGGDPTPLSLLLLASCIPGVERKGPRLRLLGAMVVLGGAARLWSLATAGVPSLGHQMGLAIELVEVPLLLLWQAKVAKRFV